MKRLIILFLFCLWSALHAAERVALVIGNDAYEHTGKLENCVNDARAVSGMLKDAGFTVLVAENATAETMHEKLAEFQKQAAGCRVGLFFYAGHGIEDEGKNYLVPVDAALERKAQVSLQTLGLAQVLEKMKDAKIPAKIVLLDCCRNMPLGRGWRATRGGGGMVAVDGASLPESTLVYFATAPGTEALDAGASGKHSPFTEGLLQKLQSPGIHAFEALMQVEDVVHQQTGGRQRPKLFSDGETAVFRGFSFAPATAVDGRRVAVPAVMTSVPSDVEPTQTMPETGTAPKDVEPTTTQDIPFENSLGMKFLSVPISKGPTAGKKVLFSIWETRVRDFETYEDSKGTSHTCPAFEHGPEFPVIGKTCEQARSFCRWLTEKEQNEGLISKEAKYRLPIDHEWSCAIGIGEQEDPQSGIEEKDAKIAGVYPWGSLWPPQKGAGNYPSEYKVDSFEFTSPVGSFLANQFGVYDLGGNVWEWCDSSFKSTSGIFCDVARGGAWMRGQGMRAGERSMRSSFRSWGPQGFFSVSGVPSTLHRVLLPRIHRCHSLQIYDTYEVRPPYAPACLCGL